MCEIYNDPCASIVCANDSSVNANKTISGVSNLIYDFWIDFCWKLGVRVKRYASDTVEHLIILVIGYTTLCVLLYIAIVRLKSLTFGRSFPSARRVLFIMAHPDDECMFFGPTILNTIRSSGSTVYLLCLSTGKIMLKLICTFVVLKLWAVIKLHTFATLFVNTWME